MYIFHVLLFVKVFIFEYTYCDWIDMPEFSDETKIYRIPLQKYNKFHKLMQDKTEDSFPYYKINSSVIYDENEKSTTVFSLSSRYNSTPELEVIDVPKLNSFNISNENNTIFAKKEAIDTSLNNELPSFIEKPNEKENCTENDTNFLNYVPLNLIKQVHAILESQSMSFERKMTFLKSFERNVLKEIEFRMENSMAPIRKTRGASDHYDHGWDEHDDHGLGFPSIEGALMAISFLTFAVYLVRLVMMLFRNMNNNTANNGTTVYLGKKKRSIHKINDDTARILSSVDNFVSSLSPIIE